MCVQISVGRALGFGAHQSAQTVSSKISGTYS